MSLTKCQECGGEVSTMAAVCPHCGYQIEVERQKRHADIFVAVLFALIVIGLVIWLINSAHQ